MAAKVGARVILSDSSDFPECLERCRETCALNDLKEIPVVGLTWGEFSPALLEMEPVNIILGSDSFYDTKGYCYLLLYYQPLKTNCIQLNTWLNNLCCYV